MDPLRHDLTIACDAARAFDLYTVGMGTWWLAAYTPDPETFSGIDGDPAVDGGIALRQGAERVLFGRVLVWEPARHFAQSFWLAMSREHPTRLDVWFTAVGAVCTVALEHGGWTSDNASARAEYSDWPLLLGSYAEAAARYN